MLSRATEVRVAGRVWTLSFTELPGYAPNAIDDAVPLASAAGCALLGLLLAYLLYFYAAAKEKAEVLAERIKKELHESEEKYRVIFDSLQDVLYRTDSNGNITLISPSIERYTGIPAAKMLGMNARQFYKNPDQMDVMLKQLRAKKTVSDYGLELRGKDGEYIKVSLNARVLLDDNGGFVGVEGVLRDVTKRSQAEDELKRLNALMVDRELKMIELKEQLHAKK